MLTHQMEVRTEHLVRDDLVFVTLRQSFPVFFGEGERRASRGVAQMKEKTLSLLMSLADSAYAAYAASEDPHRRFRHRPYMAELTYLPTFLSERYLSFSGAFTLHHGGRELFRYPFGDTLCRNDGKRLPLLYFLPHKQRGRHGGEEYYIDEEGRVCRI